MPTLNSEEKTEKIRGFAEDAKAERIEIIPIAEKSVIAEYIVVCSGNSDVHVRSIADRISEKMRELKSRPTHIEGENTGWVLMDFGDVLCNVMREEHRQFYDLESLWKQMPKKQDLEN